jgi:Flp pilus assembly protein TadB
VSEHDPGFEQPAGEDSLVGAPLSEEPTLIDDVRALLEDGKTYVEAEVQFQKSRAAFALDRGKSGAVYGVAALALVHLALIALVVGLVIALVPLVGAWAATAVVVGVLLAAAIMLALAARKRFARLSTAFGDSGGGKR